MKTLFNFFILFCIVSCQTNAQNSVVDAATFAKGLTQNNIQILDVRTMDEYNNGHIKNALQANWNDTEEFAKRTVHLDKTKPVYLYCQAGSRSAKANSYLQQQGYKNIVELKGGMIAWKQANQVIEGANTAAQMTVADYKKLIADSTKIYLVDFGAVWCPPCVQQKPIIEALQKEYPNKFVFIPVDAGLHINVNTAMGVSTFPTLFVYKKGKQTMRFEGLTPKEMLVKELFK